MAEPGRGQPEHGELWHACVCRRHTQGNGPYTGLHSPSQCGTRTSVPRLGAGLCSRFQDRHSRQLRRHFRAWKLDRRWRRPETAFADGTYSFGIGPCGSEQCSLLLLGWQLVRRSRQWICQRRLHALRLDRIDKYPRNGNRAASCGGQLSAGTTLAEFGTAETATEKNSNNGSPIYWDPTLGSRSPEYINWTFGLQRQLTRNMSLTVTYVGSEGHFISVSKAIGARNNELPESMAALSGYALPPPGTGTTASACTRRRLPIFAA